MRVVAKFLALPLDRAAISRAAALAGSLAILGWLGFRYAAAAMSLLAGQTDFLTGNIDPAAIAIFAPLCLLMLAIVGLVLGMLLHGTAPQAGARPHARGIAHWGAETTDA